MQLKQKYFIYSYNENFLKAVMVPAYLNCFILSDEASIECELIVVKFHDPFL